MQISEIYFKIEPMIEYISSKSKKLLYCQTFESVETSNHVLFLEN